MGIGVADYDCDGWFDIFKTNFADDTCNLYHNNGDGTFSDVTFSSGIGINNQYVAWGCSFLDYNRDGHLDLFVSSYLDFDFERAPKPGENVNCTWKGIPVNCGPKGLTPGTFTLYCPCHGSAFDLAGKVTHAPANVDLGQLPLELAAGVVTVTVGSICS